MIGAAPVLIITAIILDLTCWYKFILTGGKRAVKIAEIHDIYDAATIKDLLSSEGIVCHLQG